ncbi:MAG: radical SAM protein [Candidatus Hodarchaeota archaeon]
MKEYPRWISKYFAPYDPIDLARKTQAIVCKGNSRKYTKFYCVGVYGGISTGYTVGCCLRCVFCWVDPSRDFPERMGNFFTPQQVFLRLINNAKKKKIPRIRISGGEPALGKGHLLNVLDLIESTDYHFILETNGILFGADKGYVHSLKKYSNIHIRLSLKAGTPEGFQQRTGAKASFYELPYQGIRHLKEEGISFHVACMSDPWLMPANERRSMFKKLKNLGYRDYLEEETCDPYDNSLVRLEKAEFQILKR